MTQRPQPRVDVNERVRAPMGAAIAVAALALGLAGVGCMESEAVAKARLSLKSESVRLRVADKSGRQILGAREAIAAEETAVAKAFDYTNLNAPLGARLTMYRTPEGTTSKAGVVLLQGKGDLAPALKALAQISRAGGALVVEGVKATPEEWAATLGFRRPGRKDAGHPCPIVDDSATKVAAEKSEEVALQLRDLRVMCESLRDMFSLVHRGAENKRGRRALSAVDRLSALQLLFGKLSDVVTGPGDVFVRDHNVEILGCVKEEVARGVLREVVGEALAEGNLSPAVVEAVKAKTTVEECRFRIVVPVAEDVTSSSASPTLPARVVPGAVKSGTKTSGEKR